MAVQVIGALIAIVVTIGLLELIGRIPGAPEPYDWPVWVYRVGLAVQDRLPWGRP